MNKLLVVLVGVVLIVAAASVYFVFGNSKTSYLSSDNQQYQTPVVAGTNVSTSAQQILKYSGIDLTPFQSQLDSAPSDIVNIQSP